jgi:integrase
LQYGAWLQSQGLAHACALTTEDVPPQRSKRRTNVYTDDDVELLLIAGGMVNERTLLLVMTLADCGLRIGEALALRWEDVHLDYAPVPRLTITETKTGVPRVVPMTPRLAEAWQSADLQRMREGHRELARDGKPHARPWADHTDVGPFPMSYPTARRLLRGLCADAQIAWCGVHALRHYYATALLSRGVDVLAVSRLLGHSTVAITASTYAHTTPMTYKSVLGWD